MLSGTGGSDPLSRTASPDQGRWYPAQSRCHSDDRENPRFDLNHSAERLLRYNKQDLKQENDPKITKHLTTICFMIKAFLISGSCSLSLSVNYHLKSANVFIIFFSNALIW